MSPETFLGIAERFGVPGIVCFIVLYAYYQKDKALALETRARIEDAKIFYERMAKAQEDLGEIADKFSNENEVRVLTRELVTAIQQTRSMNDDIKQRDRDRELRDTASRKTGGQPQ